MPASLQHLHINFERIKASDDAEIKALLKAAEKQAEADLQRVEGGRKPNVEQLIWARFVAAADEAKIADRIPGSVGRRFASQYGKTRHRAPRGRKVSLSMTSSAEAAVERYRRDSDPVSVQEGTFIYTSKPAAVRTLEAMLKRATNDIEITSREASNHRNALKALLRKVDPEA